MWKKIKNIHSLERLKHLKKTQNKILEIVFHAEILIRYNDATVK